jgi:hypothetical protein
MNHWNKQLVDGGDIEAHHIDLAIKCRECNMCVGARPTYLFSCRLKRNHDTHEFILEIGTFANSNKAIHRLEKRKEKERNTGTQRLEKIERGRDEQCHTEKSKEKVGNSAN